MTAAALSAGYFETAVTQSASAEIFESVTLGEAGLAIWRRELSSETVKAAEAARQAFTNETLLLSTASVPNLNDHACFNKLPGALIKDLIGLALLFQGVARTPVIKIRLETVTDDACRLFHIDNVRLRLVTTYAGVGTQCAPPENEESAVAAQQAYDGRLDQLWAGDVALFRGKRCLNGAHVYHRSPPIGEGPNRLVCVIDETCAL